MVGPRDGIQREQTRAFPRGKARSGWVERERVAPAWDDEVKGYRYEYELYEDQAERIRVGGRPFLIVSHISQLRENHQRIVRGPNGGLMHVDAGEVLADDMEKFAESDERYYLANGDGTWTRRDGQVTRDGFMFPKAPWAGGEDEALDPQWERETYTLPIAEQVAACKVRRLDRAEAWQEFGDKRGTTLNLQAGASNQDAYEFNGAVTAARITSENLYSNFNSGTMVGGAYFSGVSGLSGVTIDACVFQGYSPTTGEDDVRADIYFERADAPSVFTTSPANNISARTWTTASVEWIESTLGDEQFHSSPSLVTPMQEVADNHDPSAIVAILSGIDNATINRFNSYDSDSAQAAKLDIDYTAGGGGDIEGSGAVEAEAEAAGTATTQRGDVGAAEAEAAPAGTATTQRGDAGAIEAEASLQSTGQKGAAGSGALEAVAEVAAQGTALRAGSAAVESEATPAGTATTQRSDSGAVEAEAEVAGAGNSAAPGLGAIEAIATPAASGTSARSNSAATEADADPDATGQKDGSDAAALEAVATVQAQGFASKAGAGTIEAEAEVAAAGATAREAAIALGVIGLVAVASMTQRAGGGALEAVGATAANGTTVGPFVSSIMLAGRRNASVTLSGRRDVSIEALGRRNPGIELEGGR